MGGVFSFDVRKLKSPGDWSHHVQCGTAHWSRESWDLLGQCLQSAKHAGNYVVGTIGKKPSYGCHGKVGPLLWAGTPCPPALSTIHFHVSPLLLCLSVRPSVSPRTGHCVSFPIFFSSFPIFLSPFLPPLILPSPISPSCHSGLPTGYRQGLNATRPSKHHGRMTGQRLGAPGDSTSPPKILTYMCGKA